MSSEHRYVGVARPLQGLDPAPPRVVVELSDRPRQYASLAAHRRRWRRLMYRRFEIAAWVAAVAVVVGMGAYVARQVPLAGPPAATGTGAAPVADGAVCVFEPCGRKAPSGLPTRLRIASIGVESALQSLALDARRQLEAPKAYEQAGWYAKGVVPGDAGPAVVAGHVDSPNGPAIFYDLHTLRPGDLVEVERGGEWIAFRVTTTEQYPKDAFPSDRVYQPTPDAELRLITCGGDFNRSLLSYRDNIVVYAIVV